MLKSIVLHGATNWGSSNFGDFLYGKVIYDYLKNKKQINSVGFYNPSKYFTKYIGECKGSITKTDLLLYIPGGYFGQSHKSRFIDNIIQFIRFMPVGIKAISKSIDIGIIGIGAGPIKSILIKKPIRIIGKHARIISVRDHESYDALIKEGIKNVIELSDLMLAIDMNNMSQSTKQVKIIREKSKGKKILFVHYNHSELARDKFASLLNCFLKDNHDYQVIIGSDCILPYEDDYYQVFMNMFNYPTIHYIYDSPFEMIELLKTVDAVITCKLHVGVVAAMYNKPVVCFAEHPEKTQRFYNQIGESNRCLSLYDTTEDEMLKTIRRYISKSIVIPQKMREKAQKNFELIDILL